MISIDSHGWIERFTSGPKSSRYNEVIDKTAPNDVLTSVVALYEVYRRVKKEKGEQTALGAVAAMGQTRVAEIDQSLSLEAADYSLELGLHFADALVYATARRFSARLYTGDEDLKSLPGVTFI
ncbi:MAG: type II toxin-antitoxin system VapC family toxin [Nitrososphaerota archaeon]|nr:type II toxin-antitoxin system VapC family toxin [Nitrososphaerota archaeon]